MTRELLHVYGPLSINSFGIMIIAGLAVFYSLMCSTLKKNKIITQDQLFNIMFFGIFTGLVSSRLICLISDWHTLSSLSDILKFWQGGYSVLGAIAGNVIFLPLYISYCKLPVLPILDLLALYAPLLQAIAKFGCLFAGCCYGKPTSVAWAITYHDPSTVAPLGIALHPTQIYSSILLCLVFFFLYKSQTMQLKPGSIFAYYLIGSGFERFLLDFLRDDQEFCSMAFFSLFSIYQWIALGIMSIGIAMWYTLTLEKPLPTPHHEPL